MLKISWFYFTLINAILLTALNFNLFSLAYARFDHQAFLLTLAMIVVFFALMYVALALFFVRFLSKFFAILFLLISILSAYFMHRYGILIDFVMIDNILKTDVSEMRDLITLRLLLCLVLAAALCIVIIKTKITRPPLKKHLLIKTSSAAIALIIAFGIFMPLSKTYIPFFRNNAAMNLYILPFQPFHAVIGYGKRQMRLHQKLEAIAEDAHLLKSPKKRILVLVVGETARAANYSLADFNTTDHNDTNFYTKPDGVVFYNHFSSCGTSTAISVPCMFSHLKRKQYSSAQNRENVLDVLQRVGVDVSWFGNNSGGCQGVCDRLHQKVILKKPYDEVLLPYVKKQMQNLKENNLIILHLQGSHGPAYYKRYPKQFRRFTPSCDTNDLQECSKQALINTYDNTLLYTDFILSQVIQILKEQKDYETALLYLSDHGESLGENGIYLHAMPYLLAPSFQTHIPAIFWSNNRASMQMARNSRNLELSHDNLFSFLLGFFHVKTALYEPGDDLLNPSLKPN